LKEQGLFVKEDELKPGTYDNKIVFRIDKSRWIRICEVISDKILLKANRIGKQHVVPDTHKDKTRQVDAEGFVRIRPKRIWDIK